MQFSSPDYPVFLIAVFFLYALARWGGPAMAWARIAVMVLLGDVVFAVVAKDLDALWDPIGGLLLRLATGEGSPASPGPWVVGAAVLVGAVASVVLARRTGDRGSSPARVWLRRGVVGVIAGAGAAVAHVSGGELARWAVGTAVLGGALVLGRRAGTWIASDVGQAWIARGLVCVLAAVGATVVLAWRAGALDQATRVIVAHGHLAVLAVLGVGLGATRTAEQRVLGRVVILFVASALFYHAWAAAMPGAYRYLLALLLGTIVLDYYLGVWIERTESPAGRTALLVVSLCSNLGVLVFFKYADFFTQDVLHLGVPRLALILPAGISFHTFQSLSYTIDVYRRQLRATRSVVSFATFVLFFPQLVAGPIVRAQDLLPQLAELPPLELSSATAGIFRVVVGLFKKIALADALALALVDRVFDAPEHFSAIEVIAAVYGYALQIYLDFSAYSDIAIGSAQILGFTLPENFRTPYRSANLQEFWRRWHISLSTWLRDYLYVTLGGSRGSPWRTYINLIATMVLGGLWHGASWTFVVWGALHGVGLAATRYFQRGEAASLRAVWRVVAICAALWLLRVVVERAIGADTLPGAATWLPLVLAWLSVTPLWAALTAWLSRDEPAAIEPAAIEPAVIGALGARLPELFRRAMVASGLGFLVALARAPQWTWIPLLALTWALGLAADAVEHGRAAVRAGLARYVRRALAAVLVFQYVCLAWIFFRATSFDNALAVLRQIATLELDHANLVPIVTTALAAGFACHLWANASLAWLGHRFAALPPWAQGAVLVGVVVTLRALGSTKIVPFIYFQF